MMDREGFKPRLFIGSSKESKEFADALHANLQNDAEVTVWDQNAFRLSKSTLENLIDIVAETDFGVFVLSPDDVTDIRGVTSRTVRDNVIFELGLFIGRIGRERSFLVIPAGYEDLHLPTDLLGITGATFSSTRRDRNWRAALGPASREIISEVLKLGSLHITSQEGSSEPRTTSVMDAEDVRATLLAWMGGRALSDNQRLIRFDEIDIELNLPSGSAKGLLKEAGDYWGYEVVTSGAETILFQKKKDITYF